MKNYKGYCNGDDVCSSVGGISSGLKIEINSAVRLTMDNAMKSPHLSAILMGGGKCF